MGRPRKNPEDPKWNQPQLLVARESFVAKRGGVDRSFVAGTTRIMSDHPWLRGLEHLFEPVGPSVGFETVEQATAAPGERRGE